ncbi:MAG TPA: hypothetical protein VK249_32900 [Anaerolineales bacterium]|nr:hypothetical protein [Anaerolineales bacterium]
MARSWYRQGGVISSRASAGTAAALRGVRNPARQPFTPTGRSPALPGTPWHRPPGQVCARGKCAAARLSAGASVAGVLAQRVSPKGDDVACRWAVVCNDL